jgi:hypothetical protein
MVQMPDGKREALSSVDAEFVERVAQAVRAARTATAAAG